MTRADVIVVGAGLAGLACARDLVAGGTDVLVVEARARAGGRVEAQTLDDGRTVELGGELVGHAHRHYLGLVAELGLALESSYVAEEGVEAYDLSEGVVLGDGWLDERDQAASAHLQAELVRLAAGIDPADPWSEPDAARLDRLSVADLLRSLGATPGAYRLAQLQSLATGAGSIERLSLLAELRAAAAGGGVPMNDPDAWESLRLVGGSSRLVYELADDLGSRIRLAAPVRRIDVGSPCTVELVDGEKLSADAVVCAIPVGPLRAIELLGLSDERLRSLHRQRHLLTSKAVVALDEPRWRSVGWNGLALSERGFGGFWVQGAATLSSLVGPDQAGVEPAPEERCTELVLAGLRRIVGPVSPTAVLWRHWGQDPYSLGYAPHWAPGDLTAVGPLHGTHEPPFYVAGSDHWAAGYMEGAVATGRGAARALLGQEATIYG